MDIRRPNKRSAARIWMVCAIICNTALADDVPAKALVAGAWSSEGSALLRQSQVAMDADKTRGRVASQLSVQRPLAKTPSVVIERAWKKDWIEEGVEASRAMLIDCQKETSVVLTTSSLRSSSQRDHCYRF
jgi:hypothetical protein